VRGATVIATEIRQLANSICVRCVPNETIQALFHISDEVAQLAPLSEEARSHDLRPHPRCPVGCLAVPAVEPSYARPTFRCVSCGVIFSPPTT